MNDKDSGPLKTHLLLNIHLANELAQNVSVASKGKLRVLL